MVIKARKVKELLCHHDLGKSGYGAPGLKANESTPEASRLTSSSLRIRFGEKCSGTI